MTSLKSKNSGSSVDLPDDNLIEFHDAEIDPRQIMADIRDRIQQRRAEIGYGTTRFPTFSGATFPGRPTDIPYDPDLYHHLERVNKIYFEFETEPELLASPATRIPILGNLWGLIRRHAHTLTLFYTNRAIRQQTNVNRHMVSALNLLTVAWQEQQRTILALQEEIESLRERLD